MFCSEGTYVCDFCKSSFSLGTTDLYQPAKILKEEFIHWALPVTFLSHMASFILLPQPAAEGRTSSSIPASHQQKLYIRWRHWANIQDICNAPSVPGDCISGESEHHCCLKQPVNIRTACSAAALCPHSSDRFWSAIFRSQLDFQSWVLTAH